MQKTLHNGNTYDKGSYGMTNDDRQFYKKLHKTPLFLCNYQASL
jgi:hypothetical protein